MLSKMYVACGLAVSLVVLFGSLNMAVSGPSFTKLSPHEEDKCVSGAVLPVPTPSIWGQCDNAITCPVCQKTQLCVMIGVTYNGVGMQICFYDITKPWSWGSNGCSIEASSWVCRYLCTLQNNCANNIPVCDNYVYTGCPATTDPNQCQPLDCTTSSWNCYGCQRF